MLEYLSIKLDENKAKYSQFRNLLFQEKNGFLSKSL